ncbi:MAG: hypothetical protein AAFU61_17615, partial [Pseudomonadota bacterium]
PISVSSPFVGRANASGSVRASASEARDEIRGFRGDDVVDGGDDRDMLWGGRGADTVRGGRDSDALFGGRGADTLSGGIGNDRLEGGRGPDELSGGIGGDDFIFAGRFGRDVVKGFEARNDQEDIDLSGVAAIEDWKDLVENHLSKRGKDVLIRDGEGSVIVLEKANFRQLDAADFIF